MIKNVTLSGVEFELASKNEPALEYVKGTKEIWGPWLLVTDAITKEELFTGAGFDWSKIDTAVPQDFWDEQYQKYFGSNKWEHLHPKNYVWSYELAPVFGEALHMADAWGSLKVRLATALEQEYLDALEPEVELCNP